MDNAIVVKLFLEENWSAFQAHCQQNGLTEDETDAIIEDLNE